MDGISFQRQSLSNNLHRGQLQHNYYQAVYLGHGELRESADWLQSVQNLCQVAVGRPRILTTGRKKGITIITTSLHLFSWCHDGRT